jgi:hypothetical protein
MSANIKLECINASKRLLEHPSMQRFSRVELSRQGFVFATGQNQAFFLDNFERLLEAGIRKARQIGDDTLAGILQDNLNDERGIDRSGAYSRELDHRTWRRDYLSALGIESANSTPAPATLAANAIMESAEGSDLFTLLGVLTLIEQFTPVEYWRVQRARDALFPEVFVVSNEDPPQAVQEKLRARMYLDAHIKHDSRSHFPELLRALSRYAHDEEAMQRLREGIALGVAAMKTFYAGVEEALS